MIGCINRPHSTLVLLQTSHFSLHLSQISSNVFRTFYPNQHLTSNFNIPPHFMVIPPHYMVIEAPSIWTRGYSTHQVSDTLYIHLRHSNQTLRVTTLHKRISLFRGIPGIPLLEILIHLVHQILAVQKLLLGPEPLVTSG